MGYLYVTLHIIFTLRRNGRLRGACLIKPVIAK